MNSSTIKLLISGMLLLLLGACAPYPHTYYPAGGAYSSYGVTQRSYYGGYPYRYNNHSSHYNSNYRYYYDDDHHHDGYNSHPSWNNGYVRPNSPNDYNHYRPGQKHKQFGYQGSVPAYPDHKGHPDQQGNNYWSKPPSKRLWEPNNNHHNGRPNSNVQNHGQNHRHDDRRNQIKEQRYYEHETDKHARYENHEQAKNQRESRRRDHNQ